MFPSISGRSASDTRENAGGLSRGPVPRSGGVPPGDGVVRLRELFPHLPAAARPGTLPGLPAGVLPRQRQAERERIQARIREAVAAATRPHACRASVLRYLQPRWHERQPAVRRPHHAEVRGWNRRTREPASAVSALQPTPQPRTETTNTPTTGSATRTHRPQRRMDHRLMHSAMDRRRHHSPPNSLRYAHWTPRGQGHRREHTP